MSKMEPETEPKMAPSSLKHEKHVAAKEKDPRFTEAETATMIQALQIEFTTAHQTIKNVPFNEVENPAFKTEHTGPVAEPAAEAADKAAPADEAPPTPETEKAVVEADAESEKKAAPAETIKYLTEWQLCLVNAVVVAGTDATMRCLETAKASTSEPTEAEMGPCCSPNSRSALGEAASRGFAAWNGTELEPNLASKAVLTGFPITQNEAFSDGNKRTGMLATELFLKENGYDLTDRTAFWAVSSSCADEEADEWCICDVEKYLQEGGTQPPLPERIAGGQCEE